MDDVALVPSSRRCDVGMVGIGGERSLLWRSAATADAARCSSPAPPALSSLPCPSSLASCATTRWLDLVRMDMYELERFMPSAMAEPSDAFAGAFVGSPVCTVSCAWSWRLTSSSCAMRDMYDCSFTRALADRVLTACSARSSASRSLSIVAINEDGCCLGTCRSSPRCAADRSRIVWVSASGVRYRPTALPRAGDVPVAVASFARPWGPVVLNPADSPRIPLGKAQDRLCFYGNGSLIKANHGPYTNPNG